MITAIVMLQDNSRSISAAGNGTRITSTLAMMATGKTKSFRRLSGPGVAAARGATTEDIPFLSRASAAFLRTAGSQPMRSPDGPRSTAEKRGGE